MKILYFGGQKSGKSRLAEEKTLSLAECKPYYIASYDSSYSDDEMNLRIAKHKEQREDRFITLEERYDLPKVIEENQTYIIDCMSMWLLNNINKSEEILIKQIDGLANKDANIVFVLNNVNSGVIPLGHETRKFVDLTGIIGQKLASICDEVYAVKLGLPLKLK